MPVVKKAGSCQARRLGARFAGLRCRALDGKMVSHTGHHHCSSRQLAELAPLSSQPPWPSYLDLSRIYAAPITRLGCLAFEGQGAFAPQS